MKDEKYIKYGLFTSILTALGPILWLFTNISNKNYETILLNIFFVIVGISLVFYNLKIYLKVHNKKSNTALDLLSHIASFIFYILLIAVIVIVSIGFFISISLIQEKLFIEEDYIIYFIKYPYSYLFFAIMIIVVCKIQNLFSRKGNSSSISKGLSPCFKINKFLILTIIPLIYIIITSVVVVTEDYIYDYSFYNLKGNKYNISDVAYVNTGFVDSGKNKGEFFYNIQFENGKKFKLSYPSLHQPSPKYNNDSLQEYVDIDKLIMSNGAKKISSEDGSNYVQMDRIYVDKLLSVVRNK